MTNLHSFKPKKLNYFKSMFLFVVIIKKWTSYNLFLTIIIIMTLWLRFSHSLLFSLNVFLQQKALLAAEQRWGLNEDEKTPEKRSPWHVLTSPECRHSHVSRRYTSDKLVSRVFLQLAGVHFTSWLVHGRHHMTVRCVSLVIIRVHNFTNTFPWLHDFWGKYSCHNVPWKSTYTCKIRIKIRSNLS